MKAVVLAGGRGIRLRPLTDIVAKPLLPINGKPVLEQVIRLLRNSEITEICVVVGHLGGQIKEFLGTGSEQGVDITYRTQKEQSGTAHALGVASDFIERDMLVIGSDCILPPEHFKEMIEYYNDNKCDAALSLKELDPQDMIHSSTVRLEDNMSITEIIEKPRIDEILSSFSCAPLYIFKNVKDYLPRVRKSSRGEYEIVDIIQMMIDEGLLVKGVKTSSFSHLSSISDFLGLNFGYLDNLNI